jgi:hypothetical protein
VNRSEATGPYRIRRSMAITRPVRPHYLEIADDFVLHASRQSPSSATCLTSVRVPLTTPSMHTGKYCTLFASCQRDVPKSPYISMAALVPAAGDHQRQHRLC